MVFILDQFIDHVDGHRHVESSLACLKARLVACTLDNLHLLVFRIGVVELGDLNEDPEYLAVELLLQVGCLEIVEGELSAHGGKSEHVSEGADVVFYAEFGVLDE